MIDMFNLINDDPGKTNTAHWAVETIFADVYRGDYQMQPHSFLLYYIFVTAHDFFEKRVLRQA